MSAKKCHRYFFNHLNATLLWDKSKYVCLVRFVSIQLLNWMSQKMLEKVPTLFNNQIIPGYHWQWLVGVGCSLDIWKEKLIWTRCGGLGDFYGNYLLFFWPKGFRNQNQGEITCNIWCHQALGELAGEYNPVEETHWVVFCKNQWSYPIISLLQKRN